MRMCMVSCDHCVVSPHGECVASSVPGIASTLSEMKKLSRAHLEGHHKLLQMSYCVMA